ncbi:hypothetical protein Chor_013084 [Crotalus horridus]
MTQPFLFLLFLLTYFIVNAFPSHCISVAFYPFPSLAGASAQFTMTQPPSVSASRGQTVQITCTREGGSISSYYVSWYQQKPGTKPQLVIYQDTSRPSGIPEQFSGSVDSSSNSATMSISNVQSEDEADYFCLSYDSNAQSTVIPLYGELRQKPEGRGGVEARGKSICFRERIGPSSCPTMTQVLLLTIVLISVGPSLQQLQTLKDPEFVAVGQTVTLSCRYDGGNLGDSNHPWWAQQISENKPRTLIYATSSRPSEIPERFSGSRSGNVMSLTITGALVEDEATYYCCIWTIEEKEEDGPQRRPKAAFLQPRLVVLKGDFLSLNHVN